jgi:hypothetical protein
MSNLAIDLINTIIFQIKVNYIQYDRRGFDGGKYTEATEWSPEFRNQLTNKSHQIPEERRPNWNDLKTHFKSYIYWSFV